MIRQPSVNNIYLITCVIIIHQGLYAKHFHLKHSFYHLTVEGYINQDKHFYLD